MGSLSLVPALVTGGGLEAFGLASTGLKPGLASQPAQGLHVTRDPDTCPRR